MYKRIVYILAVMIVITGCSSTRININSFDECIAAGFPVMESYPRQCNDGQNSYTEYIGNELDKLDLIQIDYPRPNAIISSPLNITGQAVGYWYFEADFPVELYDAGGNLLGQGIATAQSDWMTEDFVPFEVILDFEKPEDKYGLLILRKDNPSGDPRFNDSLEVPVIFE
ncbi:MAG: Gmad2 immunoglobulin-like domain-containing protein [Candidatus Komeilibacteria bacterium]